MRRVLLALSLSFLAAAAQATTYTVDNLGDASDATPGDDICATAGAVCTLRAAIEEANAHAGGDNIDFSVVGTITPATPFPSIVQQTVLNGASAPGFAGAPVVVIDGAGLVAIGFHFAAGSTGSLFDALEVIGFSSSAISIDSSNNHVRRSIIGHIGGGTSNMDGVTIFGTNNTVGGADGNGNLISANTRYGILIGADDNIVSDNIIGLDAGGMAALGNGEDGVHIFNLATGNVIGSLTAAERNVISGNTDDGVDIDNAPSNRVYGNYIGTDSTGMFGLGNGDNGVELNSGTNTIGDAASHNLISGNTFAGVAVFGGTGNVIAGNDIGVDAAGTASVFNETGVLVSAVGTTVGTTTARNVISGNFFEGILIEESFATVQNNYVGLDATGTTIIGNGSDGIFAGGSITNITVGGINAGEGNVASGNGGAGIGFAEGVENSTIHGNIVGLTADGTDTRGNGMVGIGLASVETITIGTLTVPNVVSGNSSVGILVGAAQSVNVVGNRVGTNAAGTMAQPNLDTGIVVAFSTNTLVSRNLVSGNGFYGIEITFGSIATTVTGNAVGTAIDSTTAIPNFDDGINVCDSVAGTVIGTTTAGEGNLIAFNGSDGIGVEPTASLNNTWTGNSIHSNDDLGIDLGQDGVTENDAMDIDEGPNHYQNFPDLTSAVRTATTSHISGTINTEPNTSVTLHFYASAAADPSGNGEGETYLGQQVVLTDVLGNASFTFNGPAVAPGSVATATATTANGTSEFSDALPINAVPVVQFSTSVYPVGEGAGFVTVTVTRGGDLSVTSTVDYATSPGTATAGSDYTHTFGTLTFLPTEDTKTFNVPIVDDLTDEPLETINLTLFNPTVATIGEQNTAVIQLADNDNPPSLIISDVSQSEGTGGTTNFTFTVTPSAPSAFPITVDYTTADSSATAPADYAFALNQVNIPANAPSGQLTITVVADPNPEPNETFFVNLMNPSNATIADPQGLGTIVNDDGVPSINISDVSQNEGNAGTTTFTFNVTLTGASDTPITVDYATAPGTATAGSDYTAIPTTQLTFAPGITSMPVNVTVLTDATPEPNETFFVNLSNPNGAAIADNQGVGTILNDDGAPVITISDVSLNEGNAGTTTFGFLVSLSGTSATPITVDYATAPGTATAGSDYTAIPTTQLTFAPGTSSMPVNVTVLTDTTLEPNETFSVNLSNPNGASIGDPQGLGTILNDDAVGTANVSIAKTSATPTYTSGSQINFTITVTNAGPDAATNVTVTDVLPAGTTLVSATPTQGSCSGTTTVTCTLGTLANAATATIALVVTATGTAPIANTATVAAAEGDPVPANNLATAVVNSAGALAAGNIPTLSEWMLLLLAAALALAAAMKMR